MIRVMTTIAATAAIVILFLSTLSIAVLANSSNSTSTDSNHVKYCHKLKDKRTRSIFCPDLYPKGEREGVQLYG